jgi:transposase
MTPEKRYPSDLTDEEWVVVEDCLRGEDEMGAGRPLEVDLRRVWDAILYLIGVTQLRVICKVG